MGAAVILNLVMVSSLTYGKAYGEVTVDTLNVRTQADTSARILTQLDKRDELRITNILDGWYEVALEDDTRAYVSSEFMQITKAAGEVNTNSVRVRTYPSTTTGESQVIETLSKGTNVKIEYIVGDFYKVSNANTEGFIHKDLVTPSEFISNVATKALSEVKAVQLQEKTVTSTATRANAAAPSVASGSSAGQAIVADARQFLGGRYVYGGNSLSSGVDCSGFTQQIMRRHGISISRSSREQYANNGYHVSWDNLAPGDLVFFGYNGVVSHVGIYIGNGQMIHASDSSTGIIISSASRSGSKPYIGAKRVL